MKIETGLSYQKFSSRITGRATAKVGISIERIASGLRINRASDDVAGLAIANRMSTAIGSRTTAMRGLNDGVSYAQTADGGLQEIQAQLQRANELAIQAANSIAEGELLDQEYQTILQNITDIAERTTIFGLYPLKDLPDSFASTAPVTPPTDPSIPAIWDFIQTGVSYPLSSGLRGIRIPEGTRNFAIDLSDRGADDMLQVFTRDGKHLVGFTPSTTSPGSRWNGIAVYDGFVDENGAPITTPTGTSSITTISDLQSQALIPQYGFDAGAVYDSSQLLATDSTGNPPLTQLTSSYNGMTIDYECQNEDERLKIGPELTEDLVVIIIGQGMFDIIFNGDAPLPKPPEEPDVSTVEPTIPPEVPDSERLLIAANENPHLEYGTVELHRTPATAKALGLKDTKINPWEEAQKAIEKIQKAVDRASRSSAVHGVTMNEIDSQINALSTAQLAQEAARQRIEDTEIAAEMTDLIKSNLTVESSSLLANKSTRQFQEAVTRLLESVRAG